jgi:Phosphatidylglycerophosphate synthase
MIYINPSDRNNINIPNILSVIRIFLIIPFLIFIGRGKYILAGGTLVLSGISDFLDGFIARKFNQRSQLGKMLDPAADKLTLMAVMASVGMKFHEVIPFMVILVLKELLMIAASIFLLKQKKFPTAAKWYGKIGTVAFYVSVIIIVSLKAIWGIENIGLNIFLMSVTALLMIYALVKYFKIFLVMIKTKS